MSHSYRKYLKRSSNLIVRWCCSVKSGTMKNWKRKYNRTIRRITRSNLKKGNSDLPIGPISIRNGSMWLSPADGKTLIEVENWKDIIK